jgi:hypothetical protein
MVQCDVERHLQTQEDSARFLVVALPTKFSLIPTLKMANALGLDVPPLCNARWNWLILAAGHTRTENVPVHRASTGQRPAAQFGQAQGCRVKRRAYH